MKTTTSPTKKKLGRPARYVFLKSARGRDYYIDRQRGNFHSVPTFGKCTNRSRFEGFLSSANPINSTTPDADAKSHIGRLVRVAVKLGIVKVRVFYNL